jgi:hypothetical protein
MKKLLMINAAALFIAWSGACAIAGDFTSFECAGFKTNPSEAIDRDPVIKTSVLVYFGRPGQRSSFEVKHATLAGEKYERENQYRDIRIWSNRSGDYWSGISISNSRRTMIGQLAYDPSRGISARRYIEKSFLDGKLERTTTSTCVWADPI